MADTQQLTPRSARAIAIGFVSFLFWLAADLGTKEWALDNLSEARTVPVPLCVVDDATGHYQLQRRPTESVVWVQDYFELRYVENCGASFGMGKNFPEWLRKSVFYVAAIVASIALGWSFVKGQGGTLYAVSVPLVVSGAIGNLIDRMRHGFVVDFLRFHIRETWEWPTFNVADITITVGIALLLIDGFVTERAAKKRLAEKRAEAAGSAPPGAA